MSEPVLKILIIGPSNVGKSALLKRYCDDDFDADNAAATVGLDYRIKRLSVRGKKYRLNLLDTAGQERFRSLSTVYYRGAHGIIFVYDLNNRATFDQMDAFFAEAQARTGPASSSSSPPCQICLVGAKLDRADTSRAVTAEEGLVLAKTMHANADDGTGDVDSKGEPLFFETSSRTGDNVREPFVALVDRIVSSGVLDKPSVRNSGALVLQAGDGEGSYGEGSYGSGCAC